MACLNPLSVEIVQDFVRRHRPDVIVFDVSFRSIIIGGDIASFARPTLCAIFRLF